MADEEIREETPETPAAEGLQAEISRLTTELEQTKKGLSTAHQTLTEKDRALKRNSDIETRISELGERLELMATALASAGVREDDDVAPEKRQDVVALLRKQQAEQEAKRKQNEYFSHADSVYDRAKKVFADDEDALERIEDQLMSGVPERLQRAEAKVARAEVKFVAGTKKEEPDIETVKEEIKRQILEEQGRLVTDIGSPAGSGGREMISMSTIRSTPGLYKKVFPNGEDDFWKAVHEGRIVD